MGEEATLSLAVFSGTDDRLHAAAILAAGAAMMGRKVTVFLQYWALDAFRRDKILKDHGVSPEAGPEGLEAIRNHDAVHWSELFRQAKEVGSVGIYACADSMSLLGIGMEDLDPLVDGIWGVATFFAEAGAVTFI